MRILPAMLLVLIFLSFGCKKKNQKVACSNSGFKEAFTARNFSMGFTTWPFGPDIADRIATYRFLSNQADIYSEQMDNFIPWKALISRQAIPVNMSNDIASRISLKPVGHKLLLSISLLNIERTGLLADADGFIPAFGSMDDTLITNAYTSYLKYLIDQFNPDYLVLAMEVNEFKIKKESQWVEYTALVQTVKSRLKVDYPALKMAESVTLHNWFLPAVTNSAAFIKEISDYVNQQDFVAISFYPFLKGQHSPNEFQKAFDFLHSQVTKPIAFVETGHIAEQLSVPAFQLSVSADDCEQQAYLETLLLNARQQDYEFVIWWTHRDYDRLWQIFPTETKDLGLLWKDTGLQTGDGVDRPALLSWKFAMRK